MRAITTTERLILDAATDDYENLEQLYRSLSLEFSSEHYDPSNPNSFYWREAAQAPQLSEIADAIRMLVDAGFLEGRFEDGRTIATIDDPSIVWRAWFRTTTAGNTALHGAV